MFKPLAVLIAILVAGSSSVQAAACMPHDFLLSPYRQAGPVTSNTTEETLIQRLGAQYQRRAIYLGDGYYRCGSVIFPGTNMEAFILWSGVHQDTLLDQDLMRQMTRTQTPIEVLLKEQEARTCTPMLYMGKPPELVSIYRADDLASPWRSCEGMRLGMDYEELIRANPAPIRIMPNGDYAEINGYRMSFQIRPMIDAASNMFSEAVKKQFETEKRIIESGFESGRVLFTYFTLSIDHLEILLNTPAPPPQPVAPPVQKKKPVAKPKPKPAAKAVPKPVAAPAPAPAESVPATKSTPAPEPIPAPVPPPEPATPAPTGPELTPIAPTAAPELEPLPESPSSDIPELPDMPPPLPEMPPLPDVPPIPGVPQ